MENARATGTSGRREFFILCLHWVLVTAPLLLVLVAVSGVADSDHALYLHFKAHRNNNPFLKGFFELVTQWSNAMFYVVYAVFLWQGWKRGDRERMRFALIYIVVQVAVSFFLVRFLKVALGRPRPSEGGLYHFFSFSGSHGSMPSGHSTEIIGASLPLALRWKRLAVSAGLGLFVALVGFSRIYLGKHHVQDVAVGLALGSFSGWLIHALATGWFEKRA